MAAEVVKRLATPEGSPPRQCTLVAPDFGAMMLSQLRKLYQKEELCDYTIIADGQRFPCHRCVLASVSDYFAAMLMGR